MLRIRKQREMASGIEAASGRTRLWRSPSTEVAAFVTADARVPRETASVKGALDNRRLIAQEAAQASAGRQVLV